MLDTLEVSDGVGGIQPGSNDPVYRPNRVFGTDTQALSEAPQILVIDADCLIAGVLTSEGATSRLLDRWQAGDFELVVCPQLVYEVRKALVSPRLAQRYEISESDADAFARKLTEEGLTLEDPKDPLRVVPDDPKDD